MNDPPHPTNTVSSCHGCGWMMQFVRCAMVPARPPLKDLALEASGAVVSEGQRGSRLTTTYMTQT